MLHFILLFLIILPFKFIRGSLEVFFIQILNFLGYLGEKRRQKKLIKGENQSKILWFSLEYNQTGN